MALGAPELDAVALAVRVERAERLPDLGYREAMARCANGGRIATIGCQRGARSGMLLPR